MAEGVLVHHVCVALEPPLAVLREEHLYIQIAEERLVREVVIPVAHIAVDDEPVHGLELELRLVLLINRPSQAILTDRHSEGQHIRQFGEPCIDLARHGRGEERIGGVEGRVLRVGHIIGREEASEDKQVDHLPHQHLVRVDDLAHLLLHGLVGGRELERERQDRVIQRPCQMQAGRDRNARARES